MQLLIAFGSGLVFGLGLLLSPLVYGAFLPLPPLHVEAGAAALVAAGLLVGIGTRYGSGCTSGHGVCGIARRSPRSMTATALFVSAGFGMVYLLRHVFA